MGARAEALISSECVTLTALSLLTIVFLRSHDPQRYVRVSDVFSCLCQPRLKFLPREMHMPLKCLNDGKEVYAFDIASDVAWIELRKTNNKSNHLKMPCCGAPVVLKRSKLGLRYFAHKQTGQDACSAKPETMEHLQAKMAIVEGVQRAGWLAKTEYNGITPSNECWRADVLAEKGQEKIVFEVQWSKQSIEETERRQKKYAESGVSAVWLFKQYDVPVQEDIPAFRIKSDNSKNEFLIDIPISRMHEIKIHDFVSAVLNKRIKFFPILGVNIQLRVYAGYSKCWRCKKRTGVITDLEFATQSLLNSADDLSTDIYELSRLPGGERFILSTISHELLRKHGVGEMKQRFSGTVGSSYFSNGCCHCDALQGQFFEHEFRHSSRQIFECTVVFSKELMGLVRNGYGVTHWVIESD